MRSRLPLFLLCAALLARPAAARPAPQPPRPKPALILYDGRGQWAWMGELHALQLANLLGHFRVPYVIKPVEQYAAGDLRRAHATFYLGAVYDSPLPRAFLDDVASAQGPVCWFRYNLWQLAARDRGFADKYGFRFVGLDRTGYTTIVYRGRTFTKNPADPELGQVAITNPRVCTIAAAAHLPPPAPRPASLPYIVRGRNLWYVADLPFAYTSEEDRYLVFCDLLHDILGLDHPPSRRAIMRIEDVNPTTSPDEMRAIADYLHSQGVPFAVSVVPRYVDPFGFYNRGLPEYLPMSQAPEFLSALDYMVSRGGVIVLHGYTHQHDSTLNPYTGVTGDDFEFQRVVMDGSGALTYLGPVPGDSEAWAASRVASARHELRACGFTEVAWETPHYAASAADYRAFASLFPATIQRVIYFPTHTPPAAETRASPYARESSGQYLSGFGLPSPGPAAAPSSPSRFAGQFFPYIIHQDIYGQKVLPENLGNVEPDPWQGFPLRLPDDILRAAEKNLVIRDAWASVYFHPFYDLDYLRQIVTGLKGFGYTFVPLSADLE